jgi:hypothetical protein
MLDPKTAECLDLLQEECAEIIQIVSKIRRFGLYSYHPDDPNRTTNLDLLNNEVGDFLCIKEILCNEMILEDHYIQEHMKRKFEKLRKFSNIMD